MREKKKSVLVFSVLVALQSHNNNTNTVLDLLTVVCFVHCQSEGIRLQPDRLSLNLYCCHNKDGPAKSHKPLTTTSENIL